MAGDDIVLHYCEITTPHSGGLPVAGITFFAWRRNGPVRVPTKYPSWITMSRD
jgi:hypothetical protein